jgi:hypothetical protein
MPKRRLIKGSEVLVTVLPGMAEQYDEEVVMEISSSSESESESEPYCPMIAYRDNYLPKALKFAKKLRELTAEQLQNIEREVSTAVVWMLKWEWNRVEVHPVFVLFLSTDGMNYYIRKRFPNLWRLCWYENRIVLDDDGISLYPTVVLTEDKVLHVFFLELCKPLLDYPDYHTTGFKLSKHWGECQIDRAGSLLRGWIYEKQAEQYFEVVSSFTEIEFDLMTKND